MCRIVSKPLTDSKNQERIDKMQLIISEKPSTAKIIAAVVGAAEKEYDGKEFCY